MFWIKRLKSTKRLELKKETDSGVPISPLPRDYLYGDKKGVNWRGELDELTEEAAETMVKWLLVHWFKLDSISHPRSDGLGRKVPQQNDM